MAENKSDLDELARLENAATPGPWEAVKEPPGCSVGAWLQTKTGELASFLSDGTMNDAKLCAALRNAAPYLIARAREAERLEAAVAFIGMERRNA